MQALDEGRRRAEQELSCEARSALQTKEDLEVRSQVLTLREGELDARLKDRERDVEELRVQLRALNLTTRKDQATIDIQARRVRALEAELLRSINLATLRRRPKPRTRTAKVVKQAKWQTARVSTKVTARRASQSRRKPKRRR
jgi:hypothetical protein